MSESYCHSWIRLGLSGRHKITSAIVFRQLISSRAVPAPSKGSRSSTRELDMMDLKFSKAVLRCFLMSNRIWPGGYVLVMGFNTRPCVY